MRRESVCLYFIGKRTMQLAEIAHIADSVCFGRNLIVEHCCRFIPFLIYTVAMKTVELFSHEALYYSIIIKL